MKDKIIDLLKILPTGQKNGIHQCNDDITIIEIGEDERKLKIEL